MALLIDVDFNGNPLPDPGEGYRILQLGEILEVDDEAYSKHIKVWGKTVYPSEKVGAYEHIKCVYRRKLKPAEVKPKVIEPRGRPIQYTLDD